MSAINTGFRSVRKDGCLYALLCARPVVDGLQFFTPAECEMQVGLMNRPPGYNVPAHQHVCSSKTVTGVCEFLYIESGSVEYIVYDEAWSELARTVVLPGDFVLSLRGGHELRFLEETRVIEVKQGPAFAENLLKIFPPRA